MTKRHRTEKQRADQQRGATDGRGDGAPAGHQGAGGGPVGDIAQHGSQPPTSAEQVAEPDAAADHPQAVENELEQLRDRHLRLAAEYDNYRKRIARERTEMRARIQAELVRMMLDALDDLGRVTDVDAAQVAASDVIAGVELVERKLVRELEAVGVSRVGTVGDPFDPTDHEAVGTEPTTDADREGTVAAVLQPGYRLGEILVRPARVRVFVRPESDQSAAES